MNRERKAKDFLMQRIILILSSFALITLTLMRYPRSPHVLPPVHVDLPKLSTPTPESNIFDPTSGALYFYHSHRENEQGHFHTFLSDADQSVHHHLIALAIDASGKPVALFTTNDWVTGEEMLPHSKLIERIDNFVFLDDNATSHYLQTLLKMLAPQVQELLKARDEILEKHKLGRYEIVTYLPLQ
ncbi:MAG: hypothetical protein KDK50_00695 [Chlamydiia bacterium]|nr:hypothetical protein [Chlamydiia bacterium]